MYEIEPAGYEIFTIRMQPSIKRKLEQLAIANNLTMSEIVRRLIDKQ